MTRRTIRIARAVLAIAVAAPGTALAHEAPPGTEWIMADWMLLSFMVFFGTGLLAFLIAVRRGMLRRMEDAKYYLLTVEEPDYYTPEWAREDRHATLR